MNRLCLQRAYHIGPMDADRIGGRLWREDMSEFLLSRGCIPLNPYEKPMHSVSNNGLEDDESFEMMCQARDKEDYDTLAKLINPIRHVDLRMVDHADFIICNLDYDKKPTGTFDEIFTAERQKKPILLHCPQGKKNISFWLFDVIPHEWMFDSWDEMKEYLVHIDTASDEEIDDKGRWIFFDMEPVVTDILKRRKKREQGWQQFPEVKNMFEDFNMADERDLDY